MNKTAVCILCSETKRLYSLGRCRRCYDREYFKAHPEMKAKRYAAVKKCQAEQAALYKTKMPERPCMECRQPFAPVGPFNRRCTNCNARFAAIGRRTFVVNYQRTMQRMG